MCTSLNDGHACQVPQLLIMSVPGSARHPLKAAAWIPLEADLSEANWSALLIAAGFHPEQPTVWLAEGLLMYIQPPAVDAMLREMAGARLYFGLSAAHVACSPLPQLD